METPFIGNIIVLIFDNKNIIIRYRLENNIIITYRHSFIFQYLMNGKLLSAMNKKKDLRTTILNDLEPSQHCSEVVKTANRLVGFIGRTLKNKSEKKSYQNFLIH